MGVGGILTRPRGRAFEKRRQTGVHRGTIHIGADGGDVCFVEIDDEQQRLRREELEPAQPLQIVARQLQRAQRRALLERVAALQHDVTLALEVG